MPKERPLWHRLYFDPVYTAVARVIGYEGFYYREMEEKLQPLYDRFDKVRVESAVYYLATYEGQMTVNPKPLVPVSLRPNVRKLCFQLLGPPPEPNKAPPEPTDEELDEFQREARRRNKLQLLYLLRDGRRQLARHGKRSNCGKRARQQIAAAEAELVRRS